MGNRRVAKQCFRLVIILTILEWTVANSQTQSQLGNPLKVLDSSSSANVQSSLGTDRKLASSDIRKRRLFRGEHSFNLGIPIPDIPDPIYSVTQHLDYWPYKKTHRISIVTLIRSIGKLLWYFYDIACIGFRIAFQVFDIFQMKKSFDYLNHHTKGSGGWGWDDKRTFHHVLN